MASSPQIFVPATQALEPGLSAEHPIEIDEDDSGASVDQQRFPPAVVLSTYPQPQDNAVVLKFGELKITASDVRRLRENDDINDTLIQFYMSYLRDYIVPPSLAGRVLMLNPFFYDRMGTCTGQYLRIKQWSKNMSVVDMDYIFIPMCTHGHWSLAVACMKPGLFIGDKNSHPPLNCRALLFFDSIAEGMATTLPAKRIRKWLSEEYRIHGGWIDMEFTVENMPTITPIVPQQSNCYDCGIFVLQFIESFIQTLPRCIQDIGSKWFSLETVSLKRKRMLDIIDSMTRGDVLLGGDMDVVLDDD
jgi:Ulp1 family protease